MTAEFLLIVTLWCQWPAFPSSVDVRNCREEKIQCVRKLHTPTADSIIEKCLKDRQ